MLIQTVNLCKTYDNGLKAVKDVNIAIEKGEFVFLTGQSGAGKSTLIRLLFREEIPTSGQILIAGRSIARAAKGEGCKHRPSEDKTPIRSVIKTPRFPAGNFVLLPALSAYTVTRGSGAFWRGA